MAAARAGAVGEGAYAKNRRRRAAAALESAAMAGAEALFSRVLGFRIVNYNILFPEPNSLQNLVLKHAASAMTYASWRILIA